MSIPFPKSVPLRRGLAVAFCCLLAAVAALASVRHVSLLPPGLGEPRPLQQAAASTHVVLDRLSSPINDTRAQTGDFESLRRRADLLVELMASEPAKQYIA